MRMAVTGASGFVGGAVATALADADHEVVGFGRTRGGWSHPHAPYRRWDIASGAALRADRDFEAVVHCAALADDWAPPDLAERVNRAGHACRGRELSGSADRAPLDLERVRRLVAEPSTRASDPAPRRFLSAYSETKAAGRARARRDGRRDPASARRVRSRRHARCCRAWSPRCAGRTADPAARGRRCDHSLTHVDNLVDAVIQSLVPSAPARRVQHRRRHRRAARRGDAPSSCDRRGMPTRASSRCRTPRRSRRPARSSPLTALTRRGRPRITRYAVSQLGLERTLDLTAARTALGYDPTPTTLAGAEGW